MKQFPGTPRLRFCLTGLAATLLVAGCTDTPSRQPPAAAAQRTVAARSLANPAPAEPARNTATETWNEAAQSGVEGSPELTGIPACDDYLASYKACHRAANIYAPSDIAHRYTLMRDSLLRDSRDPATRGQMAARCNALATSLRDALHGKSCEPLPVEAPSRVR